MTAFSLKSIALFVMLMDHVGAIFNMYLPLTYRYVGRMAFPIFAFFIQEGCKQTKNMEKYLIRLGFFALISEIPFDLALQQTYRIYRDAPLSIHFLQKTNVYYTLFLGALAIYLYLKLSEKFSYKIISYIPAVLLAYVAECLGSDYGAIGVLWIFVMFLVPGKEQKLVISFACLYLLYGLAMFNENGFYDVGGKLFFSSLISLPLLFLYNGRRGLAIQKYFYWFYPLHLIILANIWLLYIRPIVNGYA